MGGSNDKTQTTATPLTPYAADIGKTANQFFNAQSGYRPYEGPVLAPVSADTTAGLDWTRRLAGMNPAGLPQAEGFATNMLMNNGMSSDMTQGANNVYSYSLRNGMTPDMLANAGILRGIAAGNQVEDPRLQAMLDTNANRAMNGAATRFGGGRYGSSAIGQGVGQAVADANNSTMLQSNENARARQLQAAGLLDSMYQGAANRGLQAANAYSNILDAGGARALQAGAMLPALNNLRYDGASRLAGIGDYYDQRAQAQKDADIKAWEANQNIDWNRLGAFANVVNGVAPSAGTMVRGGGGKPSAAQGILGGAMAGGATFGPWGALAGGILGGVSSL